LKKLLPAMTFVGMATMNPPYQFRHPGKNDIILQHLSDIKYGADMQKVLVIVGPTASGKSALGVKLARRFKGEVISADSRQVYRGLNIGTGKITRSEMRGVPHHLLDVASPKRRFSAGRYVRLGRRAIATIAKRGALPIVVGGTGFYIDALLGRIQLPDVPPDPAFRKRLERKSAPQLFAMLKKLDPARARAMSSSSERNNKARLVRALEISHAAGSVPKFRTRRVLNFDVFWLGIKPHDRVLRSRINARLRTRLTQGLVAEARRLHTAGLSYKRMRELGLEYRSLARYLQGEIDRVQLERELRSDIWRYARKQLGYWRRNNKIRWFAPASREIVPSVRAWLRKKI